MFPGSDLKSQIQSNPESWMSLSFFLLQVQIYSSRYNQILSPGCLCLFFSRFRSTVPDPIKSNPESWMSLSFFLLQVQIYSSRSNQILRSLNRFQEAANCGSFRKDGKLVVAGSDDKMVRLFEPTTRSLLRVFKGHKE